MFQIWPDAEPRILPLYRRRKIKILIIYLYIGSSLQVLGGDRFSIVC